MKLTDKQITQDKRPRGSALIMVLFTLFLVTLVVSAIFALSRQNFMNVNRDDHSAKAEFASRAGLEHAIALLAKDPKTGASSVNPSGFQLVNVPLETDPDVTYDLHLINNDLPMTNPPTMVTAPDGLQVPPEVTWVKATGKLRDRATSSSSSLVKLVGYQRPMLKQAIFGINFVEVTGNSVIEGFDFNASPMELGRRGDIAVNSVNASIPPGHAGAYDPLYSPYRGIYVQNGGNVKGQARAGVGALNTAAVINSTGGTIYNAEDPTHHTVVSEEATQVPRFILSGDDAIPDFRFPHTFVLQDLSQQPAQPAPAPAPPTTPTWVYKAVKTSELASLTGTYPIRETRFDPPSSAPGGGVPDPATNNNAYNTQTVVNPGYYDLREPDGSVGSLVLEDVCLRSGVRYHFLGDVIFKGKINVSDKQPNGAPYPDGVPATVVYIDGNVTFENNTEVNINHKSVAPWSASAPLNPRYLQIYSAMDKGEDFNNGSHTVTLKPGAKVSCVLGGSNQKVVIDGANYWGGIQSLEVSVRNASHVYFDIALWGQLLEGRGEMAVVTNTVQFYNPLIYPAAPAPPAPGPVSAPTYTTGPGWCTSMIPVPYSLQPYCY